MNDPYAIKVLYPGGHAWRYIVSESGRCSAFEIHALRFDTRTHAEEAANELKKRNRYLRLEVVKLLEEPAYR